VKSANINSCDPFKWVLLDNQRCPFVTVMEKAKGTLAN